MLSTKIHDAYTVKQLLGILKNYLPTRKWQGWLAEIAADGLAQLPVRLLASLGMHAGEIRKSLKAVSLLRFVILSARKRARGQNQPFGPFPSATPSPRCRARCHRIPK
jgi:hypothetical protein